MGAVIDNHGQARWTGGRLRLAALTAPITRLLTLMRLEVHFDLYPTLSAATTAPGAAKPRVRRISLRRRAPGRSRARDPPRDLRRSRNIQPIRERLGQGWLAFIGSLIYGTFDGTCRIRAATGTGCVPLLPKVAGTENRPRSFPGVLPLASGGRRCGQSSYSSVNGGIHWGHSLHPRHASIMRRDCGN
jgi:hypothetical protein